MNAKVWGRFGDGVARNCARRRVCLAFTLTFSLLLAIVAPRALYASVFYEPQSLRESVRQADAVVLGKLKTRSRQTYIGDSGSEQVCGTNYSIQVLTTYKGESRETFEFSSYGNALANVFREAAVGDELLVLLKFHSKPYDPARLEIPDVRQGTTSKAKQNCLRRLSRFSTSDFQEAAFLVETVSESDRSVANWLTYLDTRTSITDCVGVTSSPYDQSCDDSECASDPRRRILWAPLEKQLIEWTH